MEIFIIKFMHNYTYFKVKEGVKVNNQRDTAIIDEL